MAILKGKDGTVSIGGAAQGEVSSWSVSVEADTLETTAMGTGGWKTFVGSLQSWSGTIEMFATTTTAMASFITGADVVVVLVDTPSTGNTWTGTAVITSVSIDVASADLVTLSLDLTGDGELVLT
jgi:hypothetical protein